MTAQDIATHDVISFDDLKQLAGAKPPCLTMLVPLPNPLEIEARLNNAIRDARKALAGRGTDDAFLEPIRSLADTVEAERSWATALTVLRSPDLFRYYWQRGQWKEAVSVADRFQVRHLFAVMAKEQRFHLLALSQKHVRLFHCTQHKAEEVSLRGFAPENFQEWLNTRQPDHDLQNRLSGIPSTGSMKGVVFGTSTDREREEESLRHFLKEVDKGVTHLLRNDTAPLVLAGVEYEVAMYRGVNTYSHLLDQAINGSPDGLPEKELYERGWEVVSQSPPEPLKRALAEFERQSDRHRVTSDACEAIKAAFEGRVADLFFTANAQFIDNDAQDMVNAAALETVRHRGRAFELSEAQMPVKKDLVAVLRF